MGDEAAWGRSAVEAFGAARFRLLLSGTPFRTDDTPIPWVTYDAQRRLGARLRLRLHGRAPGRRLPARDLPRLRRRHGVDERRPAPRGRLHRRPARRRGRAAAPHGAGPRRRLGRARPARRRAAARAHPRRRPSRRGRPRGGGRQGARRGARRPPRGGRGGGAGGRDERRAGRERAGSPASPPAPGRGSSPSSWSPRASTCPRLRVGVYATSARTELFFRQVVGRFIRRTPRAARPDEPPLHARRPDAAPARGPGGGGAPPRARARAARRAARRAGRARPLRARRPVPRARRRARTARPRCCQTTQPGEALQLFADPAPSPALAAFTAARRRPPAPSRPAAETAHERRERLRAERGALVAAVARLTGEPHRADPRPRQPRDGRALGHRGVGGAARARQRAAGARGGAPALSARASPLAAPHRARGRHGRQPTPASCPRWEPGTVAVLSTGGGAPHAIPVSTGVRAGPRAVVLALALRRESLARLREDPRCALTILGRRRRRGHRARPGDASSRTRWRCRTTSPRSASTWRRSRTTARTRSRSTPASRWHWTDEEAERRDAEIRAALAALAGLTARECRGGRRLEESIDRKAPTDALHEAVLVLRRWPSRSAPAGCGSSGDGEFVDHTTPRRRPDTAHVELAAAPAPAAARAEQKLVRMADGLDDVKTRLDASSPRRPPQSRPRAARARRARRAVRARWPRPFGSQDLERLADESQAFSKLGTSSSRPRRLTRRRPRLSPLRTDRRRAVDGGVDHIARCGPSVSGCRRRLPRPLEPRRSRLVGRGPRCGALRLDAAAAAPRRSCAATLCGVSS